MNRVIQLTFIKSRSQLLYSSFPGDFTQNYSYSVQIPG